MTEGKTVVHAVWTAARSSHRDGLPHRPTSELSGVTTESGRLSTTRPCPRFNLFLDKYDHMELVNGVYALPQTIEREGVETTFYPAAVETSKGLLLVDTGYPGLTDQIGANLADAGFDWGDVSGVLVTHQDGDHAGSLSTVVDRTGAVVYAHEWCAPYVSGEKELVKSTDSERYPPTEVDVELVDGVTFHTGAGPMEVVFTPGHAPGHVSLYLPDTGLLLAADALTAGQGTLQGPSERFTPDMRAALESVSGLATRAFDRTLCYHGGFVEEGADRAAELVEELA
jgi:glyoxylase-like metal-dependent hydrolase (beta-lactamase superfamily II)